MAVGDTVESGLDVRKVPPTEVVNARHFDQLTHHEQHVFLKLRRGEEPAVNPFQAGEVIVFTDYYRVER